MSELRSILQNIKNGQKYFKPYNSSDEANNEFDDDVRALLELDRRGLISGVNVRKNFTQANRKIRGRRD